MSPKPPPGSFTCPRCGSTDVRCSASRWRHFFRKLRGSRRRYCPACGRKWNYGDVSLLRDNPRFPAQAAILLLLIASGIAFVALANVEWKLNAIKVIRRR